MTAYLVNKIKKVLNSSKSR